MPNTKYAGIRIKDAIYMYLKEYGPQSQKEIIDALVAGSAQAGREPATQIERSIDRLIRAGKLRKVGDKIEMVW